MTRFAYLFAALAGFLFLHRPLEGQARVARVLTAQDTAAIVKLARGLAIPGGSLDVGTIRVGGRRNETLPALARRRCAHRR